MLLGCSAFLSGSETSLFSLSSLRVRRLGSESKVGGLIASLLAHPRSLLTTILVCNVLVNVFASSLSASMFRKLGDETTGVISGPLSTVLSVVVMTFLILVFGEITPKTIAIRNGLIATFMPKPFAGINGSGMHVHQSLFRESDNAFFDPSGPYMLSKVAQQFIAGQLAHVHEFVALTNPLVNSYKRLLPGYEAPIYIAWGQVHRSALIRIPSHTEGRDNSVRAELRSPDPSCNVYLALAAMLAAGLDGIEHGMEAPDPIEENIYELSPEEVQHYNIASLPGSLLEALDEMEGSALVRDVLGEHTFTLYMRAKKAEWKEYAAHVSNWERERYTELY